MLLVVVVLLRRRLWVCRHCDGRALEVENPSGGAAILLLGDGFVDVSLESVLREWVERACCEKERW